MVHSISKKCFRYDRSTLRYQYDSVQTLANSYYFFIVTSDFSIGFYVFFTSINRVE